MWADRSLLDTWAHGMSLCNCIPCSPHLHMLSNTDQCFVHLSRFGPCPYYPNPELVAHPQWESQSKPTKRKYTKNGGCKCSHKQMVMGWQFFHTLYQANGCWFWANNDPCIHSTELEPSREFRFICSPFRPT